MADGRFDAFDLTAHARAVRVAASASTPLVSFEAFTAELTTTVEASPAAQTGVTTIGKELGDGDDIVSRGAAGVVVFRLLRRAGV